MPRRPSAPRRSTFPPSSHELTELSKSARFLSNLSAFLEPRRRSFVMLPSPETSPELPPIARFTSPPLSLPPSIPLPPSPTILVTPPFEQLPPSPPPRATRPTRKSPQHPVPFLSLTTQFLTLDNLIDLTTHSIARVLRQLVNNASSRVEAISTLSSLRIERDTILALEFNGQQRSREMLAQAKKEMQLQEAWMRETREIWDRADREGLDVAGPPTLLTDEEEGGEGKEKVEKDTRPVEEVLLEERAELYRRQLHYLAGSTTTSEARLRRLLSRLSSSDTLTTSRAELARLHTLSNQTTRWLSQLSVERTTCSEALEKLEVQRERAEERRGEVTLDLVLRWDAQRKERMELQEGLDELVEKVVRFAVM